MRHAGELEPTESPAAGLFPVVERLGERGGPDDGECAPAKAGSIEPEKAQLIAALTEADAKLDRLAHSSEAIIVSAVSAFKSLAELSATALAQAQGIVERVEKESMGSVLEKVRAFCQGVKTFLDLRLEAAGTILGMLYDENEMLGRLSSITQSQAGISRHLRQLSVFTNVEVAHLGLAGGNFHHLAAELSAFSKLLGEQTVKLNADTENRKQEIAETRAIFAASLPQLRKDMVRMEEDIVNAERGIEAGIARQASIPVRFQSGVEATAQQIAGIIAAIQSHDITRQQIEHVRQSLQLILSKIELAENGSAECLASAYAGLNIQNFQLNAIKETLANWTSQIEKCMSDIRRLSASEVISIGPLVLEQERELSLQLAHIERLQHKSQEYGSRMQTTLSGLTGMTELVNEHLERSDATCRSLKFLMFNSLIEARRLAEQGAVVSAIANLIRDVSDQWNGATEQSRVALDGMLKLVKQTERVVEALAGAGGQNLREDRELIEAALEKIRTAAAFVADESAAMDAVTEKMRASLAGVGSTEAQFGICIGDLEAALSEIKSVAEQLAARDPQLKERYEVAEVEDSFSRFYTTEIEREVMRAALHGAPMPVLQQSFAGNTVELF